MKFIFTYTISLELFKRRSKVQKKECHERALNFGQWKTFSENYKPMRVWLSLVYKICHKLLSLATFLPIHSNSKEVSYHPEQNLYPNLKTICHIKSKFFLWTKLLENFLFAKYFMSVAAPLRCHLQYVGKTVKQLCKHFNWYKFGFMLLDQRGLKEELLMDLLQKH